MTTPEAKERASLHYRLIGSNETIGAWGHPFVRNLAGEISKEWQARLEYNDEDSNIEKKKFADLEILVDEILPFFMLHSSEYDAIDLLVETELLHKLPTHFNKDNHARICLYVLRCADYIGDPDQQNELFRIAYEGYLYSGSAADALRVAIKMNDKTKIDQVFAKVEGDEPMQKQLGFILGKN